MNLRENKWKTVEQICSGLPMSVMTRVFGEFRNSPQSILEFYNRIGGAKSISDSLECSCVVLRVLVFYKHYDDALGLIKELMIKKGVLPLELLGGLMDSRDVGCRNDAVFDTLVRACTQIRLTDGGYEVIKKLRAHGYMVSIHAMNNFLDHLSKLDDNRRFWTMYKDMVSCGYIENVYTYNVVIHALCNENLITYGTMINGFCRVGKFETAVEVYDELINTKKNPNLVIYNSIVDGLCKEASLDAAKAMVDALKETCVYDVVTFNTLLNGYCINGEVEKAFRLFCNMRKGGVLMNRVSYNIMIKMMCKCGLIQHAKEILSMMIKEGICPDGVTYTTMITSANKISSLDEVLKLHDYMVLQGIIPDRDTYKAVVSPHLVNSMVTPCENQSTSVHACALRF
ncbi:unnamed protein product [Cuscuta campestris]|uniref:Pentacotripeptide-repeat region of PRORP domain-containing protein n=1 Tax=Cuscuta campestris TaxID=132261 RepID=A0A484NAF4_9ASTE|nr:unnamed protein product [Cuscuta campestris]